MTRPSRAYPFEAIIATPMPGLASMLGIRTAGGRLSSVHWLGPSALRREPRTAAAALVVGELEAYFHDPAHRFSLPLDESKTRFQDAVRRALQGIAPGSTLTYGTVAANLGSGARAVGGACRANPVPIVVPCHRVVAVNGMGGFMGQGMGERLAIKEWLLVHEGVVRSSSRDLCNGQPNG